MKKVMTTILLLLVVSLTSVFAESWQDYIQRAQAMDYNVQEGIKDRRWDTWSYDKWGALMATYDYLEQTYRDIYMHAPGLSEQQRDIYRDMYQIKAQQYRDMTRLLEITYGNNSYAINSISERKSYWFAYLNKGGIITFD